MSEEFLSDRRQALEDSFFLLKNQELLAKLRDQLAADDWAQQCGIADPHLVNKLRSLGVGSHSLCALVLVPLIQIAWADKKMERTERDAVLQAVDQRGIKPGSPAYELVSQWLQERPSDGLFSAWSDYLSGVLGMMSDTERADFKDQLVEQARTVAEAAGGLLGFGRISPGEQKVLQAIKEL